MEEYKLIIRGNIIFLVIKDTNMIVSSIEYDVSHLKKTQYFIKDTSIIIVGRIKNKIHYYVYKYTIDGKIIKYEDIKHYPKEYFVIDNHLIRVYNNVIRVSEYNGIYELYDIPLDALKINSYINDNNLTVYYYNRINNEDCSIKVIINLKTKSRNIITKNLKIGEL